MQAATESLPLEDFCDTTGRAPIETTPCKERSPESTQKDMRKVLMEAIKTHCTQNDKGSLLPEVRTISMVEERAFC